MIKVGVVTGLIASLAPLNLVYGDQFPIGSGKFVSSFELFQECDFCPIMVVLPLKAFTMGAPLDQSASIDIFRRRAEGEPRGLRSEGPEHEVTVDLPIAIGRNEITYGEWLRCYHDGGCQHEPDPIVKTGGDGYQAIGQHPIINISFEDMREYAAWINEEVGEDVYRLPTEAEWEYAARSGTHSQFAQGEEITREQAQYLGNEESSAFLIPVPVGQLSAENSWGIRHMSGNVSETTLSCWSERHRGLTSTSAYLFEDRSIESCRRVSKGGSYNVGSSYLRPAARSSVSQTHRSQYVGFRLVRDLE